TEVYPSDFYPKIHFVLTGANHLKEAIPGAPNPFTLLAAQDKPLYHALCVLGGNLPLLLWQKMQHGLGALGVPQSASDLYLRQVQENYFRLGFAALTGPLARKDFVTIEKNLSALSGDPYQKIYSSFLEACQ
ncbi:MAG: DUF2520 domain-containing protein, partial [Bdellovibrionaceae bacterium]|nr:DUF2520 domain-containing protein [Pseudobdellovibrionaceae bacterium]